MRSRTRASGTERSSGAVAGALWAGAAECPSGARRARKPESLAGLAWSRYRRHALAVAGGAILLTIFAVCFGAPLFVSADAPNHVSVMQILQPPSPLHPFGTDDVGRDNLLRAIFGGRISLQVGLLSALISVGIGAALGGLAGFHGGWVDTVLMRFTDALLSIPTLFILIVLTHFIGQTVATITAVIGGLSWMTVCRLVRANVLSLKQEDFVAAARSIGARSTALILRHLLPNSMGPVVVAATLGVGQAIIFEASLSFLGLGVQPPTATWGNMLFRAQGFLAQAPWMAVFPGLLILAAVLSVNLVGEGLQDALDPRSSE
jgi:peptide/nickel transport system permease protein